MRTKDIDVRAGEAGTLLSERKTSLEAAIAKQRNLEASLEDARVRQSERSDEFNVVQGRYYKVGSDIARLEQSIEHARELRERQQQDLEQAISGAKEIADHIDQDETEIEQLEVTLNELVPGLQQARQSEQSSAESLKKAEDALEEWQNQWSANSVLLNEAQQQQSVEQTRAEQIESRLLSFSERRNKIQDAQNAASPEDLQAKCDECVEQELRKRQARDKYDRHLGELGEKIRKLRQQDQKLTSLVDERHATLQAAQGKFASLDALQQAALGEGDEGIRKWLGVAGLEQNRRVAQTLNVENGWDKAVETVLGDYLQAVCVSDITPVTESIASLKGGCLTVLREQSKDGATPAFENTLAEKVTDAPAAVMQILSKVVSATSIGKALDIRESLDDDTSVITTDGVWLGKNWLRVSRDSDGKAGVLAREHEMRRLKSDIREMQARYVSAKKLLQDGRGRLTQFEERREKLQKDASLLLNEYSEVKAALESARYRLDQANARKESLVEEAGELNNEQVSAEGQLRESKRVHNQAADSLQRLVAEKQNLDAQRDELRTELERVRAQAE